MDHQDTPPPAPSSTSTASNNNAPQPSVISDDLIKNILLEGHFITSEDINKAESFLSHRHISFLDYVLIQNLLSRESLGTAIAKYYQVPFADLEVYQPSKERISMV